MDSRHGARVWEAIVGRAQAEGTEVSVRHAVIACARTLSAAGAGLTMIRDGGLREPVYAYGRLADELEELQSTIGQGPGIDAAAAREPLLIGDLTDRDSQGRWPMFASAAVDRGARAIFAFPIGAGGARIGLMVIYREQPGKLTEEELGDALAFADAALVVAADHSGEMSLDMRALIEHAFVERRAEVHQASGMVAAQLGVGIADALVAMHARAYAANRRLADLAADILARRIRFSVRNDRDKIDGSPQDGTFEIRDSNWEEDR